jgi:hypothetical protein
VSWLAAALTALGMVVLLSKLAWAETPARRGGAALVAPSAF